MHKIKKIRSLCFVNFWWNLRKCRHFFILSLNKSGSGQFNWVSIFNIANSHSLADFSFSHLKKIHQNRFIRKGKIIPQLSILKQDLVILKMKKCLHYLKFHQKLIKQSDLIFFYFMHVWPSFGHLLLNIFKCSDWDCTKTSQPIIFWVGAFKGLFKKTLWTINKTPETFL